MTTAIRPPVLAVLLAAACLAIPAGAARSASTPQEALLAVLRAYTHLEGGDILSLGSLGPPLPLAGLTRVTATYAGLADRPLAIHVGFK